MNKDTRQHNFSNSMKRLNEENIQYQSFNDGIHLKLLNGIIDFFPSTELWIHKPTSQRGRGVMKLIKYVKSYKGHVKEYTPFNKMREIRITKD